MRSILAATGGYGASVIAEAMSKARFGRQPDPRLSDTTPANLVEACDLLKLALCRKTAWFLSMPVN